MSGRLPIARALTLLAAVRAAPLAAQAPARPALTPEVRVDGAFGREGGAFGGAGLFGDAGLYTRVGVVAAVGLARDPDGVGPGDGSRTVVPAARLEALARFHLDPLRMARRGVYLGGGVAAAVRDGAAPRWQLVALLGVEGAPRGRLAPAVELGLGGGVRVAVALRRARPGRR
ncbi:hypothetical protein [Roseisolibacter agri]|uniref:Outer membrane protein beta-barrel domain-containing protein n=1 Tax=Roseisolibacter agri TaxID=2014610 RepID=A0AA37Q4B0_9BACT|nr:hypothetical protein [Roseisolibacter agri]GLC24367.1 hypothetical protein rosag_08800 [Roseisolibacter agri]